MPHLDSQQISKYIHYQWKFRIHKELKDSFKAQAQACFEEYASKIE
jgi:hypothetical protein